MPPIVRNMEFYGVAGYNAFVLGNNSSVCKLPFKSQIRKWWFEGYAIAKKRRATQCKQVGGNRAAA